MTVKMQVNTRSAEQTFQRAQQLSQELAQDALEYFKQQTPVRSGNARKNTSTKGNAIVADYPYADRLNTGWSRQAPAGMTSPTIDYIQKTLLPKAVGRINRGQ
jgi:hypothetical protein